LQQCHAHVTGTRYEFGVGKNPCQSRVHRHARSVAPSRLSSRMGHHAALRAISGGGENTITVTRHIVTRRAAHTYCAAMGRALKRWSSCSRAKATAARFAGGYGMRVHLQSGRDTNGIFFSTFVSTTITKAESSVGFSATRATPRSASSKRTRLASTVPLHTCSVGGRGQIAYERKPGTRSYDGGYRN
jgi:hypothetical protein